MSYSRNERLQFFAILCDRMKHSRQFELETRRLWRCIPDKGEAAQVIIHSRFRINLNRSEALEMSDWIYAFFTKKEKRKLVSPEEKSLLWKKQNGVCPYCGTLMTKDNMNENHADHIIPFTYVGDELANNLRLLHRGCNLSKGSTII